MKNEDDYITENKKKELETELDYLRGPKRKEVLDILMYAKSLGDLSENAEYHQAREDQGKLEARIKEIEHILKSSKIVSNIGGDVVNIGSKITVQREGEKEKKEFELVGSEEANAMKGKISNRSPFGEALLGKVKGDAVSFSTPGGVVNYKIINVS